MKKKIAPPVKKTPAKKPIAKQKTPIETLPKPLEINTELLQKQVFKPVTLIRIFEPWMYSGPEPLTMFFICKNIIEKDGKKGLSLKLVDENKAVDYILFPDETLSDLLALSPAGLTIDDTILRFDFLAEPKNGLPYEFSVLSLKDIV